MAVGGRASRPERDLGRMLEDGVRGDAVLDVVRALDAISGVRLLEEILRVWDGPLEPGRRALLGEPLEVGRDTGLEAF